MKNIFKIIIRVLILGFPLFLPAQTAFSMLFTANINGSLENCGCGKEPLGGVDRLATVIEQYRGNFPGLLVLNGGDYFNSYSFSSLNSAMLEALPLLGFDLFVPGDQEYVENRQFAQQIKTMLGKNWFVSNSGETASATRTFGNSGQRIRIFAYLSPHCFTFIPRPEYLDLSKTLPIRPEKNKETFNCLIIHGSREDAENMVQQYPELDLILLGHEQLPSGQPIGRTAVIASGKDGEFITFIQITSAGSAWKIDQTRIELTESIPVNSQMSLLIKKYKQKSNIKTR